MPRRDDDEAFWDMKKQIRERTRAFEMNGKEEGGSLPSEQGVGWANCRLRDSP